jgi:DNA-binding PadR family transcriptional regulator
MSLGGTLLGLLEQAPAHGYDLKRRHDEHFRSRRLALPQVYATLGRLERDGLVVVAGVERSGGPDRTVYAVTTDGIARLESWLAEPESPAPYLQPVLFTKVVLALVSGRGPADVLEVQRAAHRAQMRELTARKEQAALDEVLALDFALFHLEADLRWMQHTSDRLGRLAKELT